jgi:hypothetical protein
MKHIKFLLGIVSMTIVCASGAAQADAFWRKLSLKKSAQ